MTISILSFVLGPLANNTFLIADDETRLAAVVDPSFECQPVIESITQAGWKVSDILLTHAHFDHIAGVGVIAGYLSPQPTTCLHPADLLLYQQQGGAAQFGFALPNLPATHPLEDGQIISLGSSTLEVRHTPGHSPGHVVYYCAQAGAAFCGDLVFAGSVGRTDLPGGSSLMLMRSIRKSILSLPPETRLLCGHGPETTVQDEIESNPYF